MTDQSERHWRKHRRLVALYGLPRISPASRTAMSTPLLLIPERMTTTRQPGKPLSDIMAS